MLIVGEKEIEQNTVGVRSRVDGDIGAVKLQEFVNRVSEEVKNYVK